MMVNDSGGLDGAIFSKYQGNQGVKVSPVEKATLELNSTYV